MSFESKDRYLQVIHVCLTMGKKNCTEEWVLFKCVWGGVEWGGCFVKSNMTAKMYYTVNQYACHVVLLVFRVSKGQGSPLNSFSVVPQPWF